MGVSKVWILFTVVLCTGQIVLPLATTSSDYFSAEARDDSDSHEDEIYHSSYILPNQIFNDGKPFYVGKDPISGQLDFSDKKTAGIEPAANEIFDPNEKVILSGSSPNIHDFLNLPVKYSSSKFVYPLVSSSYANLKYQGSNKNYMSNKKTQSGSDISSPNSIVSTVLSSNSHLVEKANSTKLHIVLSTPAAPMITTITTLPTIVSSSTTTAPSSPKYTTTSRPSTVAYTTKVSTTRKKFVPTKKYIPSSTSAIPFTTIDDLPDFFEKKEIRTTEKPDRTTPIRKSTLSTSIIVKETRPTPTSVRTTTSNMSQFSPFPTSTHVSILEPGDIYQAIGNKKEEKNDQKKKTMTLADLFNTLGDDFDSKMNPNGNGNVMQPISPSKPSPFASPSIPSTSSSSSSPLSTTVAPLPTKRPYFGATLSSIQNQQLPLLPDQENYSGEYVQYQVQQPNMMKYRPIPGSMNSVVISPGQNSASFILGSQQTVGTNSFGTAEKVVPPVQYGTVINEDITEIKRPNPLQHGSSLQQVPNTQQMPSHGISNFHQNGIFPTKPTTDFKGSEDLPASLMFQQLPNKNAHQYNEYNQNQQNPSKGLSSDIQHGLQANSNFLTGSRDPLRRPQEEQQPYQETMTGGQDTQELLVSSNIRFPANDENHSGQSPPVVPTTLNGHAQPQSLQQMQNSNQVVFPKPELTNNGGIRPSLVGNPQINEVQYQGDVQVQKHEVLTLNQHQMKQKVNFPQHHHQQQQQQQQHQQHQQQQHQHQQQQHTITPAQHMEPPRFLSRPVDRESSHHHHLQHGAPSTMQQLPLSGSSHPSSYPFNDFTRKPLAGLNRPIPDRSLPNILPQFRPNAKVSSGHGLALNHEPGNVRVSTHLYAKRPNSPQFAHRRQPVVSHRYPMNRILEYPAGPSPAQPDGTRRIYRPSPYGEQSQYFDRINAKRPAPGSQHFYSPDPHYTHERHSVLDQDSYRKLPQSHSKLIQNKGTDMPEKMAAFEQDDFIINEPPQPITVDKIVSQNDEPQLEPVVTLQMLQSQKKDVDETADIQVPNSDMGNSFETVGPAQGLYVVYPMKLRSDNTEANNNSFLSVTPEPHPVVAPFDAATASDYQNTPFSVIRDHPQEPVLMLKNKRPQQQTQKPNQSTREKFPYTIEKPDPSYSELSYAKERNPGGKIAPRIINGGYNTFTGTEAPIAIAYTPTEPNRHRNEPYKVDPSKFSNINLASSVIHEIRDTQTEDGLKEDLNNRGHLFEKDFMAPFYPSVSLGSATSSPSNGWNVYPSVGSDRPSADKSVYEKNNIDRADVPSDVGGQTNMDTTVKSFELDSFQPELQGGFKPIYPPGYKLDEGQDESDEVLPSRMAIDSVFTTSTAATTTTTTTPASNRDLITSPKPIEKSSSISALDESVTVSTTVSESPSESPRPTQRKKSKFETSLEALLFGDDEDFDEESSAALANNDNNNNNSNHKSS